MGRNAEESQRAAVTDTAQKAVLSLADALGHRDVYGSEHRSTDDYGRAERR